MSKRIFVIGLFFLIGLSSCEDILEVPDISVEKVILLAPADGVVLDKNLLSLSWQHMEEAHGYHIQVATPDFENPAQLVLDSVLEKDSLGYVPNHIDQNLADGMYTWRVNAFNSGFKTQFSTHSFQIIDEEETEAVNITSLQSTMTDKGTNAIQPHTTGADQ
ncbi:hypothetical protein MACH07_22980 [Flagellimonas marinaquae]|uniref:Uncharacterized protein n=1 Tax=Flagellimonas marinaquae TaxID=254955 RepID=A0AA48I0G0_9FLAO|nr:hypothetical protein MACH07_22980 [Allomuricauda aquimarina]